MIILYFECFSDYEFFIRERSLYNLNFFLCFSCFFFQTEDLKMDIDIYINVSTAFLLIMVCIFNIKFVGLLFILFNF